MKHHEPRFDQRFLQVKNDQNRPNRQPVISGHFNVFAVGSSHAALLHGLVGPKCMLDPIGNQRWAGCWYLRYSCIPFRTGEQEPRCPGLADRLCRF